jgi:tetratricopeptide (TPR) repeat protein
VFSITCIIKPAKVFRNIKKMTIINELSDSASNLYYQDKYEEMCEKCKELANLNPEDYWAYTCWGIALDNLAKIKSSEELFKDACGKYTKAIGIKPDYHEAYYNWGISLGELAKLKGDEKLFEQARLKFEQATKINPDHAEAYSGIAATLLYIAQFKTETPKYQGLLKQAEEKALKAESLQKGSGAYNLACVYALKNDKDNCKKWLLAGQEADTLQTREHAMKDSDLDSVKNELWFKEIKWKGEK